MRLAAMVVAVAVAMAVGGCVGEAEKKKAEHEEKISAARISGKFRSDDPLVQMLSPDERGALTRAGMLEEPAEGDEIALGENGEEIAAADETKSGIDKAGDVAIAVLSVVVPIGMAVAPYLLF